MTLVTRAVTAFAVLSLAAIPVAALTIKNSSSDDVSVGVDNGTEEGVYKVPPGGTVDVTEDCSADCAVTGPWGFSQLVPQNATIETDGAATVTVGTGSETRSLVPQNPIVSDTAEQGAAPKAAEPAAAPPAPKAKRQAKKRKSKSKQAKGGAPGSWELLLQGPSKK
ncbi:hypothetical protein [Hyphomicrobium sp. CS1GBMeth3]|uniref:hypothetical protein n=1 Tax=Hyphomicrobium sp. CS1GBMeth3 TaxID=1892845 RepID=UPI0009306C96|nr:hypothetical protein [Hyphomicrobium sp. CS1GBMeth3]